jgi:16S rRNA (uracil1498-N3)-methyltransferase
MSRLPRFFISPDQVQGSRVVITGDDVRHIGLVLRMKAGEELLLADGTGLEYTVRIADTSKTAVSAEITNQSKKEIPSPRITLCQGLPKSDKMDFIVQKATELGVSGIVPLATERTIVKIRDEEKRISRWQKIAREAAMQSSRLDIPKIAPVVVFKDFLRTQNSELSTLLLFPWEEGTEPIKKILTENPAAKNVIVLIGPEGGFSPAEAALAKSRGFHAVSLGPNILRTETAAVAVLSMIGYAYL